MTKIVIIIIIIIIIITISIILIIIIIISLMDSSQVTCYWRALVNESPILKVS